MGRAEIPCVPRFDIYNECASIGDRSGMMISTSRFTTRRPLSNTRRAAIRETPTPSDSRSIEPLTEAEVQRSFRILLKTWSSEPDALEKAEALLDNLRPESPLRHRLCGELDEVRRLQESTG